MSLDGARSSVVAPHNVSAMNQRQRERLQKRRKQHQDATRTRDLPALIMDREHYTPVENAHIVPRMYQKAFAIQGKVAVHRVGESRCSLLSTKRAGTRDAYYRRTRPDGEQIDDVEASLAEVENKSAPILAATIKGAPIDLEAKGGLAQFFAIQLMRGPAFFEFREELLLPMLQELGADDLQPAALADAGGDVEVVRRKVIAAYLDPTTRFMTMLQKSMKIAGVIGNMRWHVLRFKDPVLAYSDHPVVLWPAGMVPATPFDRQHLGPLSAVEVRVPIAPDRAILMNWLDLPDAEETLLDQNAAAELNAFTISQADVEWMHTPGHEPPVAEGTFTPLSRVFAPAYGEDTIARSVRRAHAADWLKNNEHRNWVNDLKLLDLR
jgi:hypothetical protein